jgi:phosphoribosylformylglycinamidine synthase subunit PurL
VAQAGREGEIEKIFRKWEVDFAVVGRVTDDGWMRISFKGEPVVAIPVEAVSRAVPELDRPLRRPGDLAQRHKLDLAALTPPQDLSATLRTLLGSPNLCSRRWVYRQYDQMVQGNTVIRPGGDAAVVRIPGTKRALAVTTDCNPRYCALDPDLGAQHAVAEAARNVAVTGARPLAVTNCLNFGSPEKPEVMWEFAEAVRGMGHACRTLGTPVVSGNVSFYNETEGEGSIPPTPTIGMLGLLEDASRAVRAEFAGAGDAVVLIGSGRPELGGSEYLAVVHGIEAGRPPALDLEAEKRLLDLVVDLASRGWLRSAHDVAEGGLAIALVESALRGGVGAEIRLEASTLRPDVVLFGESAGRVLISCRPTDLSPLLALARERGVAARPLGTTGGDRLRIEPGIDIALREAQDVWGRTLPEALDEPS